MIRDDFNGVLVTEALQETGYTFDVVFLVGIGRNDRDPENNFPPDLL
jgi:hypothetical protein